MSFPGLSVRMASGMQKRILQKLEWEGLGTRLHFSKLGFIHLHDIELGKGLLERVLCMEIY